MGCHQHHLAIFLLLLALFSSSHILAASLPRSLPVNSHPEEALAASRQSVGNLAKSSFLHSRQTFLGQVAKQGREEAKSGLDHNTGVDIDLASGTYSYTLNL